MSDFEDAYTSLYDEFDDDFDMHVNQPHADPMAAHRILEEMGGEVDAADPTTAQAVVLGGKRERSQSAGSSVGFQLGSEAGSEMNLHQIHQQPSRPPVELPSTAYTVANFDEMWTQASEAASEGSVAVNAPLPAAASQEPFSYDATQDDLDFEDWGSAAPSTTMPAPVSQLPSIPISGPKTSGAVATSNFLEDFKRWFPNAETKLATPSVTNVVAVVYLGVGVDLRVLCCSLRNIEFTNKSTPKATLRLSFPRCVAIIRNSGVVTILGASSVSQTRAAAELVARLIRVTLRKTEMVLVKLRIRCLMVRFDLQHPIRLDELAIANPAIATYEPESFCGCLVSVRGTLPVAVTQSGQMLGGTPFVVSCSVYTSGKVTMSGAHSVQEVSAAYKLLLPILAPHTKR